ncbi:GNAT family N-acetyltransferase [Bacillus shivajii]|uniref:GNAT family N-acetyltransferase n=1 Tax=Bacillus shivajii TaxID=1983719 RepID=UPI001CFB6B0D|nr:GNAT family N-acetyltransferase [Bacillus shivajii]UCZ52205.1 GNAT family N-acetyltransferase [Bacillus shivajii]
MNIYETDDVKLITTLNRHVQNHHANMYPHIFKPYNENEIFTFFKEVMPKPQHKFYVLENKNIPIGYTWVEIKRSKESPFKKKQCSLYVHQISINESERGQGYGLYFMKHIENVAHQEKIHRIELDYWCKNTTAKEFYSRQGFVLLREEVYKDL